MLTYLLIAINVAVSLIAFSAAGREGANEKFVFSPYDVSAGRNYRGMILSHFSHADATHLIFNMVTLYSFGPYVELFLGIPVTLLIYVVAGVASTLVIYFRHRSEPGYRCLGASDSVSAIIFASIVLVPGNSVSFIFVPIPIPAPLFAIGYIVVSTFLMGRGSGRISHEAHLAGAFTGLILAGLLSQYGFSPLYRSIRFLLS